MPHMVKIQETFVIETAGAATFVREAAKSQGKRNLAERAGGAALHLLGMDGLYRGQREDQKQILADDNRLAAQEMLKGIIEQGGILAPAAEAVLVELANPEQFWAEIEEAKTLSKTAGMPTVPPDARYLERGFYDTGPVSAVDLPRAS